MNSEFKTILVRSPNWIGDVVLSYPFFHFLRRAYPRARIVSVCVPWVESVQFRNLVDDVIVLPKLYQRTFSARWSNLEEAANLVRSRGPWDMGIVLPDSFSSAWIFMRAGVRVRRGFRADGRGLFLNQAIRPNAAVERHRADSYLDLLPESAKIGGGLNSGAQAFWGVPPENDLDPGIPGVLPRFDAGSAWPAGEEAIPPPEGPYWVLAPGSLAESRRWPIENFARLAREVVRETGWTGVIVGGVQETAIADALLEDPALKLIDRTAQGGIPALSRLLTGARFTVSNDSGLAHVASLCGSPVQLIWGAGDPKRTSPLGPGRVRILFNPVDCWPCERNTCLHARAVAPERWLACLKGIQASAVWEEINSGIISKPRG